MAGLRPTVTFLPKDIQARIVRMARDQDEAYKHRLKTSRDKINQATTFVTSGNTWYGRSLWALYGTCRAFRKLACAYAFETVKLSQIEKPWFDDAILPTYEELIKHLILNNHKEPDTLEHAFGSVISMKNLYHITLLDNIDLRPLATPHPALRPALDRLKTRIKELTVFSNVKRSSFCTALKLWPFIERLSRATPTGQAEGEAIASLTQLEFLDLSTGWHPRCLNVDSVLQQPLHGGFVNSWEGLQYRFTLTSLYFGTRELTMKDWEFVLQFKNSLQELTVEALESSEEEDPRHTAQQASFPFLRSFTFNGDWAAADDCLALLAGSPITSMRLDIISLDTVEGRKLLESVHQFLPTLRDFRMSSYGYQSNDATKEFNKLVKEDVMLENRSANSTDSLTFYVVGDSLVSNGLHAGAHKTLVSFSDSIRTSRKLLRDTLKALDRVERHGDNMSLNTVTRALQPVAALQLMSKD